jgi:hypothetical protein
VPESLQITRAFVSSFTHKLPAHRTSCAARLRKRNKPKKFNYIHCFSKKKKKKKKKKKNILKKKKKKKKKQEREFSIPMQGMF